MVPAQPELDEAGTATRPVRRRTGGSGPALVVLAVLLAAVVVGALLLRPAGQPAADGAVTSVPSATSTVADRNEALRALLDTRSQAVLARDQDAWLSTVDAASVDYANRQSAVFANLQAVPLETWDYELAGAGPSLAADRVAQLSADDAWVARVVLSYRLQDSGSGDVRREQHLTLVQRAGTWLLADDRDGSTAVDLWDLGAVQVVRGQRSLLMGTADAGTLTPLAKEVDRASERVDDVWGTAWPRTVVVMVPQDQDQMAALLARSDPQGLEQIAAVTTGEIGLDSSSTSADRVIVNPAGFATLGPLGRDVVLTHEITHVATRATTTTAVPIWLSEGFCDYVAYTGTGLAPRDVARDVLDAVRGGSGPAALPASRDFDPTVGDIAPAYSGAWLAARMIAKQHGQDTLVAFYRSVAGGSGAESGVPPAAAPGASTASPSAVDAAFTEHLQTDEASFTRAWLAELQRLAG